MNKKHNNTAPKKTLEPIGTRIAKAVFEESGVKRVLIFCERR